MHYFSEKPTSRLKLGILRCQLREKNFEFITAAGVFSPKKIDKGSLLLIENMKIADGERALDLGCGYGPIGITAAALAPHGHVVLTDVNERAIWLAKKNIKHNKIHNAEVRKGYLYETAPEKFDCILTNPPVRVGMETLFKIIEGAKEHLNSGGTLQIVVRTKHGAKRISGKMNETFGNVYELTKKGGYRVYLSRMPG